MTKQLEVYLRNQQIRVVMTAHVMKSSYRVSHSKETVLLKARHDIAHAMDSNYLVVFAGTISRF